MISCRTHDGQQKCDRIQGELDELEETWLGKKQMIFSNASSRCCVFLSAILNCLMTNHETVGIKGKS
jgi:hypothetical protein